MTKQMEGVVIKSNLFDELVNRKNKIERVKSERKRIERMKKEEEERVEKEKSAKYSIMESEHDLPDLPEEMSDKNLLIPNWRHSQEKFIPNFTNDKLVTELRDSFSNVKKRLIQTCKKYETNKYNELKLAAFKVFTKYYFEEHYKGLGNLRMYFPDGDYSTMKGYGPKRFEWHASYFIRDLFNLYQAINSDQNDDSRNFRINLFRYYVNQIGGINIFIEICKFQETCKYKEYTAFKNIELTKSFGDESWLQFLHQ